MTNQYASRALYISTFFTSLNFKMVFQTNDYSLFLEINLNNSYVNINLFSSKHNLVEENNILTQLHYYSFKSIGT